MRAIAAIAALAIGQGAVAGMVRNDTGGPASYGFDFTVQSVPVPAAVWLFGSTLLGVGRLARRERRCLRAVFWHP